MSLQRDAAAIEALKRKIAETPELANNQRLQSMFDDNDQDMIATLLDCPQMLDFMVKIHGTDTSTRQEPMDQDEPSERQKALMECSELNKRYFKENSATDVRLQNYLPFPFTFKFTETISV